MIKARTMRKAEQRHFVSQVSGLLTSCGGWERAPGEDSKDRLCSPEYHLITRAGPASARCYGGARGLNPWIYFQFHDVARAAVLGVPNLNAHTGKWNFHYGIGTQVDDAFLHFKRTVGHYLISNPCTPSLMRVFRSEDLSQAAKHVAGIALGGYAGRFACEGSAGRYCLEDWERVGVDANGNALRNADRAFFAVLTDIRAGRICQPCLTAWLLENGAQQMHQLHLNRLKEHGGHANKARAEIDTTQARTIIQEADETR